MRALFRPAEAGRYVLFLLLAFPAAANAQWKDHARVSINFGIQQPASTTFDGATTKTVNLETARFTTTYDTPSGQMFDGGVLFRIARGFGAGVAFSSYTKSSAGSVTGAVPHPFFFNTPRTISGTVTSLERSETAVHVQVAYVIAAGHLDVAVAGGPTFFNVQQDLVADVTYTEAYPYDTAAFGSATVSKVSVSKTGFNVGADVGWKFSKKVGVGGLIRYSKASAEFPLAGSASGVTTDVGGVQAGGGIRFHF